MKPKYTLPIALLLLFSFFAKAQRISHINLRTSADKTSVRSMELLMGDIIVAVSPKGAVRVRSLTNDNYGYANGKLQLVDNNPILYYSDYEGDTKAGKIKAISSLEVNYYDRFDGFDNIGKVKSIGSTTFTYNDRFDGLDNTGKVKSIGNIKVTYFDRFDGADLNGRIKSIGNTTISYYDRFDGGEKTGTIKSITGKTPHVTIDNLLDNADDDF